MRKATFQLRFEVYGLPRGSPVGSSAREAAPTRMRNGILEYCLLARLKNAPSYGLESARSLDRCDTLFRSEGSITLCRHVDASKAGSRPAGTNLPKTPPRRYCVPTSSGGAALAATRAGWSEFRHNVDSIVEEVLAALGPVETIVAGPDRRMELTDTGDSTGAAWPQWVSVGTLLCGVASLPLIVLHAPAIRDGPDQPPSR